MKWSMMILVLMGFVMAAFNNCTRLERVAVPGEEILASQDGTRTGNPLTPVAVDGYEDEIELTFCMVEVELTRTGSYSDKVEFGVTPRWVNISPTGSSIGNIVIPKGDYRVIELDANDQCGASFGVQLRNKKGVFQTSSEVDIIFDGQLTVASGAPTPPIVLNFDNFVSALSEVRSNSELITALTKTRGEFRLAH